MTRQSPTETLSVEGRKEHQDDEAIELDDSKECGVV
jgi:hypothetical protein